MMDLITRLCCVFFVDSSCESTSDTEYHSDVELERSYLRSRSRDKSESREYSGYSSLRGRCSDVWYPTRFIKVNFIVQYMCFG